MPLSKQQAESAADAVLYGPKARQARIRDKNETRKRRAPPASWMSTGLLISVTIAGSIDYMLSGRFFQCAALGIPFGISITHFIWKIHCKRKHSSTQAR